MNFRKHRLLLAAALAVSLGGVRVHAEGPAAPQQPAGPATQPAPQDLQSQIAAMRAQLDKLEAQQQTLARQHEADVTAADVLKDAQRHSMLIDSDQFFSGFENNRFTLQSADGNYVFRPWVHIQVRDSTNYQEMAHNNNTTQNGIELRRARFGFDGNLFSPDFTYFINWATYRADNKQNVISNGPTTANPTFPAKGTVIGTVTQQIGGLPVLEEAWMQYHLPGTQFSLKAGQMHDPLDHENIVGSKYRAAEASLQGDIMGNTDTFTKAITVLWNNGSNLRTEGGINDGIRSANTDFQERPNNDHFYDYGLAGRIEYKVFGNWKDYGQLTSYGNTQDLLVIGAGVDDSNAGLRDEISHTVDIQYASKTGLFVYGSYFGRYTRHNTGIPNGGPDSENAPLAAPATVRDTYEPTALLYVSYLVNQQWEPFGRYEYLHLAGTPAGSKNDVNEISLGVNYYFHGHNLKFTGQCMYLPNGIPINDTSSDVLANNGHGEVVFIAQMQLLL